MVPQLLLDSYIVGATQTVGSPNASRQSGQCDAFHFAFLQLVPKPSQAVVHGCSTALPGLAPS